MEVWNYLSNFLKQEEIASNGQKEGERDGEREKRKKDPSSWNLGLKVMLIPLIIIEHNFWKMNNKLELSESLIMSLDISVSIHTKGNIFLFWRI